MQEQLPEAQQENIRDYLNKPFIYLYGLAGMYQNESQSHEERFWSLTENLLDTYNYLKRVSKHESKMDCRYQAMCHTTSYAWNTWEESELEDLVTGENSDS